MVNRSKKNRKLSLSINKFFLKYYFVFLIIFVYSLGFLLIRATQIYVFRDSLNKTLTIGVLGDFTHYNPFLAKSLGEKIVSNLVYCALVKLNPENLSYFNYAANSISFSQDLKEISIKLQNNMRLTSSDYEKFFQLIKTRDDIINPIKINFQGVDFKKIDDKEFKLVLSAPYSPFLYNLTFPIADSLDDNAVSNCGLYSVSSINNASYAKSIILEQSSLNNNKNLKFSKIIINVYNNENGLISDFNKGKIKLVILNDTPRSLKYFNEYSLFRIKNGTAYSLFFNLNNQKFQNLDVRRFLDKILDKSLIVKNILNNNGNIVYGPLNFKFFGLDSNTTDIIKKNLTNPGIKDLKISYPNTTNFSKIANLIKQSYEKYDLNVSLEPLDFSNNFFEILKNKNYDILLIGQNYIYPADPYSFWASSQVKFPGQNLANYQNKDLDNILDEIRQTPQNKDIKPLLNQINEMLFKDMPAIFLFSSDYIAITNKKIHLSTNLKLNYPEELANQIIKETLISN